MIISIKEFSRMFKIEVHPHYMVVRVNLLFQDFCGSSYTLSIYVCSILWEDCRYCFLYRRLSSKQKRLKNRYYLRRCFCGSCCTTCCCSYLWLSLFFPVERFETCVRINPRRFLRSINDERSDDNNQCTDDKNGKPYCIATCRNLARRDKAKDES